MKKLLSKFILLFTVLFTVNNFAQVKYVYLIDYPMGGKTAYLDWAKTVIPVLQKPEELVSFGVYENNFNESPHRVVEFEFADNLDAAKYFENPEIRNVIDQVGEHGIVKSVFTFKKRGDYTSGEKNRAAIKYVSVLDYGVANKSAYLDMVKTVVKTLQTPKEVKRITSFENYFNGSPNRIIEFEFDSIEDCVKYFEMPEVKNIVDNSVNISVNHRVSVLKLKAEYNKK
jgi:hypothetical protein